MSSKKLSNGAVIVKKEIKIQETFSSLKNPNDFNEFFEAFKNLYPKEWLRVNEKYEEHQKLTKLGKGHPMPKPEQYMQNAFNHGLKKFKSKQVSS